MVPGLQLSFTTSSGSLENGYILLLGLCQLKRRWLNPHSQTPHGVIDDFLPLLH